METPLISIVIPIYKVPEAYLRNCIESCLSQVYDNKEILLIDDGSPDECGKICDEYANKSSSVSAYHKKNGGVSSARNYGLFFAKGAFVLFLDADDWLNDNALMKYSDLAVKTQCDVVHVNSYLNKGQAEKKKAPISTLTRGKESLFWFQIDTLYPYIDQLFNNVMVGSIRGVNGKLYKKSIIDQYQIRFNEKLKIGEDALFNYHYFSKCSKVTMANEYLLHYRIYSDSVMHKYNADILNINNNLVETFSQEIDYSFKDNDYVKIGFWGMIAECVFRAMKLYFLNPQNNKRWPERRRELRQYLENPIVKDCLAYKRYDYLPHGKKEIMWLLTHGLLNTGMLVGKLAIKCLENKKLI